MRTTAELVLAIMNDVDLEGSIVDNYITGANAVVTQVLTGSGLPDPLLAEIERWLSAHMIASTRERIAKEEGAGGAYIKYAGEFDQGLASTPYGQMVLTLDSSGEFAKLMDGKKQAWMKTIPQ